MKTIISILTLVIVGCGPRTTDTTSVGNEIDSISNKNQTLAVTDSIEDFDAFFERFKSDSLFQLASVKFPWTHEVWEPGEKEETVTREFVNKENWRHLDFHYEDSYSTRQIDAYTQRTNASTDTVRIELRGVDNGIYIDYDFIRENGHWVLVSEKEYSN